MNFIYFILVTFQLTFLMAITEQTTIHNHVISTTTASIEEINSISLLDQQLQQIFFLQAKKIFESNTNIFAKRILLKFLFIKLMRTRQRIIDGTMEQNTTKKSGSGYMHWRQG